MNAYELPPVPPAGVFDVRFAPSTAAVIAGPDGGCFPILTQSMVAPLRVRWESPHNDRCSFMLDYSVGTTVRSVVLETGRREAVIPEPGAGNFTLRITPRQAPGQYALSGNFPNPFNPTTEILFRLRVEGWTTLKVYNALGQEVKTVLDCAMQAGLHRVRFEGGDLPSGVYYYQLRSGEYGATRQMVLIR